MTKILSLMLSLVLLLGLAALPAQADGTMLVGEVTIISNTGANIRSGGSTDYPIVAKGAPGEVFKTTGTVPSGWYEILLPDNSFAYVSSGLVYFYAYKTPVPFGGSQYTIPVYYMTQQNQTLKVVNVPVRQGQNVITADDSQVPGYRLTSTRSIYVFVDQSGNAVPNGVIFNYEPTNAQPPQLTATIAISYKDIYNQLVATEYRTLKQGSQMVKADAGKLPQGYYLSSVTEAVVNVNNQGTASPSELVFIVSRTAQPPQPSTFTVPVVYKDEQGKELTRTTAPVQPGYTTVTANDYLVPQGYVLSSSRNIVVYASTQGVTFPSTVVFTYKTGVSATIQVLYRDSNNQLLYSENQTLGQGSYTITADDSRAPAGYVLQSSRNIAVTVYQNGTVSQNQVIFVYAPPVQANLFVEYRDSDGNTLHTEYQPLAQGSYTITANDSKAGSGYVLQSARQVQVTVYANGAMSPDRVVFLYAKPVIANVSIVYKDTNNVTHHTETRSFAQGTYTVTANDNYAPKGYVLQGSRSVQVKVASNGSVNPAQVVFTYAPPAPPVTVNVPVVYKDQGGAILHQTSVSVSSASPQKITADKSKAPAGYVLSGASSVTVTVSPSGNASPAQVVFVFRDPATITETPFVNDYQIFSLRSGSGTQPVYTGPGTEYYRSNNGRAEVGGGRLRYWGSVGDWALIGYQLSNNLYRVGYISSAALPDDLTINNLHLGNQTVTVEREVTLHDDPIIKPIKLYNLKPGEQVTLLAYFGQWYAYVETTYQNKPIRGFVLKENLSKP